MVIPPKPKGIEYPCHIYMKKSDKEKICIALNMIIEEACEPDSHYLGPTINKYDSAKLRKKLKCDE